MTLEDGRLVIHQEGKVAKFVDAVDQISFSGQRATAQGQDVTYVTERCVIKLTDQGLMVTEIAPGLDLQRDILDQAATAQMMDDLLALCRQIERAPDSHVLIVMGADRAFCAGGDIDAWSNLSPQDFRRHWLRDGHQTLDALARLRQPVIAVLNGHALGGGLELAACADLRVAEDHIRIGQPEPALGIIPGWSGTQRVARRFGAPLVRRMALFGEVFAADQVLALGLVDHVVARGQGLTVAYDIAQSLRHRGPNALELVKLMINAAEGEERERVLDTLAGGIAAAHPEL